MDYLNYLSDLFCYKGSNEDTGKDRRCTTSREENW